ncbi:MAG TPA: type II toxin-antitoxin system RelE/ParE family toxin [Methylobacter sp.]|jgi:plasmid stabilization system protein ParE
MKAHKVVLTETANKGLLNIAEYIALDNPVRAETFIEEILESLSQTLSVFPLAGKVYEEIETKIEIRSLPYKNYISFYRVRNDVVEILYIFNSAQNIKNILSSIEYSLT